MKLGLKKIKVAFTASLLSVTTLLALPASNVFAHEVTNPFSVIEGLDISPTWDITWDLDDWDASYWGHTPDDDYETFPYVIKANYDAYYAAKHINPDVRDAVNKAEIEYNSQELDNSDIVPIIYDFSPDVIEEGNRILWEIVDLILTPENISYINSATCESEKIRRISAVYLVARGNTHNPDVPGFDDPDEVYKKYEELMDEMMYLDNMK